MKTAVFTGGELGDVIGSDLPAFDFAIAADSGLHHAQQLEVQVDLLVGDLDSVDLDRIGNTEVIKHQVDKDASDTELAIDCALARGATGIVVVGGLGGRLDHLIALINGFARDAWAHVDISAIMGRSRIYVVRDQIELHGTPGDLISQFAVNGPIRGLHIEGLKWSGDYATVEFGSSLCLSDQFVDTTCRLSIQSGVMLVVHELGPR